MSTCNGKSEYTYEQYLEIWQDHFGDEDIGDFIYWQYGQKHTKTLSQMTKEQFEATLARLDEIAPQIDTLQKRPDYGNNPTIDNQVDELLNQSFECELPLFF